MMEVLYLSKDYIVVNKPYGMLAEKPADGADRPNMPDAVREILLQRNARFEDVFCVHRLDATTAGVMVYALTRTAAAKLSKEITEGRFRKTYLAWITADENLPGEGEMRDYLFFDRRADKSFVVKADKKGAKEARLSYSLGEAFDLDGDVITPAYVKLETGRTHQIRVQFASRKSPLAGDGKYGSRVRRKGPSLWSVELSFDWNGEVRTYVLDRAVFFPQNTSESLS